MVTNKDNSKSENISNESSSNENINLPLNCSPLTHQVAGHFYGQGRTKLGSCFLLVGS